MQFKDPTMKSVKVLRMLKIYGGIQVRDPNLAGIIYNEIKVFKSGPQISVCKPVAQGTCPDMWAPTSCVHPASHRSENLGMLSVSKF